jgi:hypothetical protein
MKHLYKHKASARDPRSLSVSFRKWEPNTGGNLMKERGEEIFFINRAPKAVSNNCHSTILTYYHPHHDQHPSRAVQ